MVSPGLTSPTLPSTTNFIICSSNVPRHPCFRALFQCSLAGKPFLYTFLWLPSSHNLGLSPKKDFCQCGGVWCLGQPNFLRSRAGAVQGEGLGIRRPGFQPLPCHEPAVQPWVSPLTSLGLNISSIKIDSTARWVFSIWILKSSSILRRQLRALPRWLSQATELNKAPVGGRGMLNVKASGLRPTPH